MSPDDDPESDIRRGEVPERFAEDQFYQALAAQHRRRILAHLLTCGTCTLEELVDVLSGWEATTSRVVDSTQVEQLRVELVHSHLPLLEEADLLGYDRSADEITIEPLSQPVERLIRQSIEAE